MAVTNVPNYYRFNGEGDRYHVMISLFPVAVGVSANVTISPAQNSTLAPILNAMEIYCAMDVSKAAKWLPQLPSTTLYRLLPFASCLVTYSC